MEGRDSQVEFRKWGYFFDEEPFDRYLPKALLSVEEWSFYDQVVKEVGFENVLVKCKLSALIDVDSEVFSLFRGEVLKENIFLAVMNRSMGGVVVFAIVENDFQRGCLRAFGVPSMIRGKSLDISIFMNELRSARMKASDDSKLKKVVSSTEFYNGRELTLQKIVRRDKMLLDEIFSGCAHDAIDREFLAGKRIEMFREVALSTIAPTFWRPPNDRIRAYVSHTSVDILLHSFHPNIPLMVIEIDGGVHLKAEKKEADSLKNAVVNDWGVVMLRVLPPDVKRVVPNAGSISRDGYRYARIFGLMVKFAVNRVKITLRYEEEWWQLNRRLSIAKNALSNAVYGRDLKEITDSEEDAILDLVVGMKEFEDLRLYEDQEDFRSSSRDIGFSIENAWRAYRKYGDMPRVNLSRDGVWSCNFVLKYDGVSEVVNLPSFVFNVPFLDSAELREHFEYIYFFYLDDFLGERFGRL